MTKNKKNSVFRKLIPWIIIALVAVALVLLPVLTTEEETELKATIKSEKAAKRDIATVLVGGGEIESSGVFDLEIPEKIKIKEYLVGNGDTVREGDPIAITDPISTMSAITGIQNTLDELTEQIRDADTTTALTYITSVPGGTVKKIYAQPGDSVEEVMLNNGCLAIISLDGTMGVAIEAETALIPGDKVSVEIDGSTVTGRVKTNANGVVKLTVEDKSYEIGQLATVYDNDGKLLGSGLMYVYSQWNVTGTAGTVSYVHVREGNTVYAGRTMFSVSDTGKNSDYQKAIDKHRKYEELLKDVFAIYAKGYIAAPCDGIVSGIDKDGSFMLTRSLEGALGEGYGIVLLGNEGTQTATIIGELIPGTKDEYYTSYGFTAIDMSGEKETVLSGTWAVAEGSLPSGLSIDPSTGIISGTPTVTGTFSVTVGFTEAVTEGQPAVVTKEVMFEIKEAEHKEKFSAYAAKLSLVNKGEVKGKCAENPVTITDIKDLSAITLSESAFTTDFDIYYKDYQNLAKDELVWIVVNEKYEVVKIVKAGGSGGNTSGGGAAAGGAGGGMAGAAGQSEDDGLYSFETVVIGTVTSQEEMTVSISIDELDITKVYVGQTAIITMNSFAEEPVQAVVTNISNSGENSGGNSKFTVDLKLNKSSEMLPGMNATATITLDTASDVLSVPSAAIYKLNGKTVVYTSYNEKEEELENPVEVEIGVADADYVQIISGITEADTVYYEIYETVGLAGTMEAL